MPHDGLDDWLKLPEEDRKVQETKMMDDWNAWMDAHKDSVTQATGVGKPKRITANGIEDARNDLMMYSFVEADSLEAAAEIFKGHPHFGIPGAWIEVMSENKNTK